jgi:hypothetical protein
VTFLLSFARPKESKQRKGRPKMFFNAFDFKKTGDEKTRPHIRAASNSFRPFSGFLSSKAKTFKGEFQK